MEDRIINGLCEILKSMNDQINDGNDAYGLVNINVKYLPVIEEAIKQLKSKTKIATWIGIEYNGYADGEPVYDLWECSACGEEHKGECDTLTDYCPNCGAKMCDEECGNEDKH